MNKKGFTLVEVLAVIIILGVVMTMGSIGIGAVKNKIEQNMFEKKITFVISAAQTWGQDNKESLTTPQYRTVVQLIDSGTLETEETYIQDDASYTCSTKKPSIDGKTHCYVIENNVDGRPINNLPVKIYMRHNRVYACIPTNEAAYATTIKNLLGEKDDFSKYAHLNYYCS